MNHEEIAADIAAAQRALNGNEPHEGVLSIGGHGHEGALGQMDSTERAAFDRVMLSALGPILDDNRIRVIHVGVTNDPLRTWSYRRVP